MIIKATTIEEQINLLKSRNLIVDSMSADLLAQCGYYNLINGYKDPFIDKEETIMCHHDVFAKRTKLSDLYALYTFDNNLRQNLLTCITIIETQIKSLLSMRFSLIYGTDHHEYLTTTSFTKHKSRQKYVLKLIEKINKNIHLFSNNKPHPAIQHYIKKYKSIPLWVLMTIMSFGTMSKFYDLLSNNLKKQIAYTINPKLTPKILSSVLYYLTSIRNKCAHGNRLYIHKIDQQATRVSTIPQLYIHQKLNIQKYITKNNYKHGQDDILAALICILLFFNQTKVYSINFNNIENSLLELEETISKESANYVREVTGLKTEYIKKLKHIEI